MVTKVEREGRKDGKIRNMGITDMSHSTQIGKQQVYNTRNYIQLHVIIYNGIQWDEPLCCTIPNNRILLTNHTS